MHVELATATIRRVLGDGVHVGDEAVVDVLNEEVVMAVVGADDHDGEREDALLLRDLVHVECSGEVIAHARAEKLVANVGHVKTHDAAVDGGVVLVEVLGLMLLTMHVRVVLAEVLR